MSGLSRVTVIIRNGDINKALKVFKKKVNESGHLLELRDRKEFVKPTTARRLTKEKAVRENQRQILNEKILNGTYKPGKKNKKRLGIVKNINIC